MNLNPLKKEDNTEALVKALEDANGVDNPAIVGQPATGVADGVADPAAAPDSAAAITPDPAPEPNTTPVLTLDDPQDTAAAEPAATDQPTPADPAASLAFSGNDLPAGLSSDANAATDSASPAAPALAPLGDNTEIDGVKKNALEQLRPLIEKLNLEPADKFEKYLMMLRASDDPALIKPAFDAAQGITGEQEKAQALLDIINEINYITANQQQP